MFLLTAEMLTVIFKALHTTSFPGLIACFFYRAFVPIFKKCKTFFFTTFTRFFWRICLGFTVTTAVPRSSEPNHPSIIEID